MVSCVVAVVDVDDDDEVDDDDNDSSSDEVDDEYIAVDENIGGNAVFEKMGS